MQALPHPIANYLRLILIIILAALFAAILQHRAQILSRFFSRKSTALNLAMVRLAVLLALLNEVDIKRILTFARLDSALLAPPVGWSPLAAAIPRSPHLVEAVYALFLISLSLSLIGLFGRWALALTSLSSFYLLTIPQLFGKVDHNHHLVIFSFLLALFPSCDTLSIDSIRAGIRAVDQGVLLRTQASNAYASGLNAILILMGLMYFFPGAWKVAGSWPHWFSSQNMESLLYRRMLELQPTQLQWSALHFPFGLVLSTYAAVFFELSMIFLILQERLRPLAFIMGLTFHNLTRLLMAIPFLALQFCYAALLDWTMLLRLIGTRLGPRILTVIYDPQCKLCRRTIAVLCNLDWLDLLDLLPNTRLEGLKPAETAFAVLSFDGTLLPGYDGYQLIASRIVPLWPVRLLMTLPLVNRIGKAIYRRGAFLRNRDIAGQTGQANMQRTPFITPGARAFSVFTICTMFLFGVAHGVNCWPLACYPTFDGPFSLSVKKLTLETVSKSGRVANYTLSYDQQMGYLFGTGRWDGLVQQQFRRQRVTKASSAALVRLWLDQRRVHECAVATLFEDNYALQLPTLTLKFEGRNQLAAFSTSDGI